MKPPTTLLRMLERSTDLLVVTGAGISLASGIPTFRDPNDPDAVWAHDVTELGTYCFFRSDPVTSWSWYLDRFAKLFGAKPNPAHHAVVQLEQWHLARSERHRFDLVTQNIDGLHRAAGHLSNGAGTNLTEVHGSAARVRCIRRGCANAAPSGSLPRPDAALAAFQADPRPETLPRCPACGDLLRPHVLWFDEYYDGHDDYRFHHVQLAAETANLVLFIGTSFAVGVTELVLTRARQLATPTWSIDPTAAPPRPWIQHWQAPAEAALPALIDNLA